MVDVAKHLGNLGFHVWRKIKKLVKYTPVVLDPNTACSFLNVSGDLCSTKYETVVNVALPDNPERFKYYVTVLGSEGYTSGRHSWVVEVQNDADWAVGVMAKSMPRKEPALFPGSWTICRRNGQCVAFATPCTEQPLQLRQQPKRMRVDLDCNTRTLKLSDAITNTHYFTFTNLSAERLYPSIDTLSPTSIHILPMDISVQTPK